MPVWFSLTAAMNMTKMVAQIETQENITNCSVRFWFACLMFLVAVSFYIEVYLSVIFAARWT